MKTPMNPEIFRIEQEIPGIMLRDDLKTVILRNADA